MANVMTMTRLAKDQGQFYVFGTIVLSGSYVQVSGAGELLDFTKLVMPPGSDLSVSQPPVSFAAWGMNGYGYGTTAWTSLQNKLKVSTGSATEASAGAYAAGIIGDTIFFEAVFDANI